MRAINSAWQVVVQRASEDNSSPLSLLHFSLHINRAPPAPGPTRPQHQPTTAVRLWRKRFVDPASPRGRPCRRPFPRRHDRRQALVA